MLALIAAMSLSLVVPAATAPASTNGTVASADGVKIHFHAEGGGEPALLFVHGWSGDGDIWSGQMKEFAPRHRVVVVDLAGHGGSGAGRKDWTIPAFGADVAAVVRKLGLENVVMVGHSMGGPVTVEAALLLPERVKLLVPVDTLQNVEARLKPEELAAFLSPFEQDFPAAAGRFVRQFFPATAPPEVVDRVVTKAASAPPEIARAALRAALDYDPSRSLPRLNAPIRAINSDAYPTRIEVNRKYARRYDVTIMKGAGHFPMLVAPAEFNRLLSDAVADLAPPTAAGQRSPAE